VDYVEENLFIHEVSTWTPRRYFPREKHRREIYIDILRMK